MPTQAEIESLIALAAGIQFPNAFNPYANTCPQHDKPDAVEIRQANLRAILRAVGDAPVDELWIALEPTYKGARRTGLAMTDGRHLGTHAARWSAVGVHSATSTPDPAENTAGHVWKALAPLSGRIFLWNAVFLHTHDAANIFKDRNHNEAERDACQDVLKMLAKMLQPKHIVAIGLAAQQALDDAKLPSVRVRHPSTGGQNEFRDNIRALHCEEPATV